VNGMVHAKRVKNRSDFAPDLIRMNTELVEKRLLIVEVNGTTTADSGTGVDWTGGGGNGGGADVK